jgi:hypothetical protein
MNMHAATPHLADLVPNGICWKQHIRSRERQYHRRQWVLERAVHHFSFPRRDCSHCIIPGVSLAVSDCHEVAFHGLLVPVADAEGRSAVEQEALVRVQVQESTGVRNVGDSLLERSSTMALEALPVPARQQ